MPSHRRDIGATEGRLDIQNNARCTCHPMHPATVTYCPRHNPRAYADHMAVHATDSIRPVR